jgi:Uma2 family endonuclease
MTTADLLALPENGVNYWLIRGQLRETPMTKRNRWHSRVEARLSYLLWKWLETRASLVGMIYSGEAGCILRHDPDTTVGIDVIYFAGAVNVFEKEGTTLLDGVPTHAAEILSPSDVLEDIDEKVAEYLAAGVPLVSVIHPRQETVTVHRSGVPPQLFNVTQELDGEPELPGFRIPVSSLFLHRLP